MLLSQCSWFSKKAAEVCKRHQDQNEEILQQAIALSLWEDKKNLRENPEPEEEKEEKKEDDVKDHEEGNDEEPDSGEEIIQLAIAMSLAQEEETQ